MKELKTPLQRIKEIHGFDDSCARGRPLPKLPEYGNIPEANRDTEAVERAWNNIQAEIPNLQKQLEEIENEIKILTSEMRLTDEIERVMKDERLMPGGDFESPSKAESKSETTSVAGTPPEHSDAPGKANDTINSLKPFALISAFKPEEDPHYFEAEQNLPPLNFEWEEIPDPTYPAHPPPDFVVQEPPAPPARQIQSSSQLNEELTVLNDRRQTLEVKIAQLEKQARKMCRLEPEVAYLQSCSEFYLLRQQEETETRIAVEQARAFQRPMGPSVNERELAKEGSALEEWKVAAEREQTLVYDARSGRDRNGINEDRQDREGYSEADTTNYNLEEEERK